MPRQKKRKDLPRLATGSDLGELFGLKADFAGEVESSLAEADLSRVLVEKKGDPARPVPLRERLKSYPPPEEELNLHGCTGAEAARKTAAFIHSAQALRLRSVLIITGKGLHSEGPPVLPAVVDGALAELKAAGLILHYSWGPKGREQSGAVVAFLR